MASDVLADRVRALERLGGTSSPRALERLISALGPGSGAATAEERLVAVRELSERTSEPNVRRALARVVGGHAASSDDPGRLDEIAQVTAALALSRSGQPDALGALGKALSGGGAAAIAAKEALVAYPPRAIEQLLAAAPVATEELAAVLSELGDQRAFEAQRALVQSGPPEVRARAAVGLTELGDYETVALARLWVRPGNADSLRAAGARILALAHAADTETALRSLLDDDATWRAALVVALDAPSPGLVPALERRLGSTDDETRASLCEAIGRSGGPAAVRALGRRLKDSEDRVFAADALARMPDDAARAALEHALFDRRTKRLAAIALGVRKLVGGVVSSAAAATLETMARSAERDERFAGALATAMIDFSHIGPLLRSRDDRLRAAVAGLLGRAPDETVRAAAAMLAGARDPATRTALAVVLAAENLETAVPTATLLTLVDDGTSAAPLAARALSARDEESTRATVDALLGSNDAAIRLHVAFGLGQSARTDAPGRLAAAYRFETDPSVRWAIVAGLSRHAVSVARRTLELAATLDPDRRVRSAARFALTGARVDPAADGAATLLVSTADTSPAARLLVSVRTPAGLLFPVVPGPDGLVVAAGLPPGSRVAVAPGGERGKDVDRGASGDSKEDNRGVR